MKKVNIYIRVNQVRNLDHSVKSYIGCLLLEYSGRHKYVFYEDMEEFQQRRCMLWLANEGIRMVKEPCDITIHALDNFAKTVDGGLYVMKKYYDLRDIMAKSVKEGGHTLTISKCNSEDATDPRSEIFKTFKSELQRYKRQEHKRMVEAINRQHV